jgi:Lrp/AsnC family transcriptional regulator
MLDELDRKILAALQVDSSLSMQELAERVGLSSTPCWRRIQKLENSGYIKRRVALLDAEKLNLGVSVFIAVRTNQHNAEWVQRFRKIVVGFPEVVDFYRLSGDVDYLIRAVVSDSPWNRSSRRPSCPWSMRRSRNGAAIQAQTHSPVPIGRNAHAQP